MIVVEGCSTRVESARPCPFCGGHNIFISSRKHFAELLAEYGKSPMMEIGCGDCGCSFGDFGEGHNYDRRAQFTIDAWNTRHREKKNDGRYAK